ncbi:MAG: Bifunctional protein pyrR [Rhodocyclaceae bacterium]|nr:MAG: bifunctional pyr operon transcriptional regulator/uracil phosphoribosyltransferase PyrR [Rhodocyclaceae bacterium]MBE7423077.1 bifunctional pyr operon transcriptional regulator/uracil phosphoribosyltransferase PyrR [Zoogloeaceae bacterium]MBV6406785.1 Bifunctional protein pyrR [Rhodocyclaceae bacterium]MCK6384551.1 bifunctional pyr operon transcriptional regulator/uracil phosphoribosyltransferase PyrR [Rhodocyclaceae bacterium]CAG0931135.1 pyrimidine operon attenuation protein / uracil 
MLPDAERLCEALAESLRPGLDHETALVGIHTGGVWVAERLHAALGLKTPLGRLDVSFYRDDFGRSGLHPQLKSSDIPFDVEDRPIIIVDDVLYTGRTIRAAMNEIFDYGRPARIDLAVLVDRGGRELPVCPRWAAQTLQIEPAKNLQLERSEAGTLTLRLIDA